MPRKITILGAEGAKILSLLARLDLCELLIVAPGGAALADDTAGDVARDGMRRRVQGCAELAGAWGAAVAVLARPATDDELRELARVAPASVLVVAAGEIAAECERALAVTAFARPRVVGVASAAGPDDGAAELAAAVLLDRRHVVRCVARCQGEDGLYGARAVRARVGARGVSEILGAPRTSRPAP